MFLFCSSTGAGQQQTLTLHRPCSSTGSDPSTGSGRTLSRRHPSTLLQAHGSGRTGSGPSTLRQAQGSGRAGSGWQTQGNGKYPVEIPASRQKFSGCRGGANLQVSRPTSSPSYSCRANSSNSCWRIGSGIFTRSRNGIRAFAGKVTSGKLVRTQ